MTEVSYSAAMEYLQCEQKYYYNHVQRIVRRDRPVAPELGTFIHEYLQWYYKQLQRGQDAPDAHDTAIHLMLKRSAELQGYIEAASAAGDANLASDLAGIPNKAQRICTRYHDARGRNDAQVYEVLFVEERIRVALSDTITSTSVIDLVTRRKDDGTFSLWEHKSTTDVPDTQYRLRDLQTLLYVQVLNAGRGIEVNNILWNYLRTKEPTVPKLLKRGSLSRNTDIDSDWDTYQATLRQHELDESEYDDMRQLLQGRRLSIFFPRFEHVVVVDPFILMRDYIVTVTEIELKQRAWALGRVAPVRTISRSCNYCTYRPMCMAALTGGDEQDVIRLAYVKKGQA